MNVAVLVDVRVGVLEDVTVEDPDKLLVPVPVDGGVIGTAVPVPVRVCVADPELIKVPVLVFVFVVVLPVLTEDVGVIVPVFVSEPVIMDVGVDVIVCDILDDPDPVFVRLGVRVIDAV